MKKNANDFIKDKIFEILGKYAMQSKNDIEHMNQNMLYILWLMREQIHSIEANLLKNEKVSIDSKESLHNTQDNIALNKEATLSKEDSLAISVVKRRAPRWFLHPKQKVSIVLLTFLKLSNGNKRVVTLNELIDTIYTTSNTFDSKENIKTIYSRTKTAKGNPNGKVFVEDKQMGRVMVMLWDKVENIILAEYEKYRQREGL